MGAREGEGGSRADVKRARNLLVARQRVSSRQVLFVDILQRSGQR